MRRWPEREFPALLVFWAHQQTDMCFGGGQFLFARKRGKKWRGGGGGAFFVFWDVLVLLGGVFFFRFGGMRGADARLFQFFAR